MNIVRIVNLLFVILAFSSCNKEEFEPNGPKRTVLVYMVASDLGNYMDNNIEQMMSTATNAQLNGGNLLVFYSNVVKGDTQKEVKSELFQIKEGKNGVVTKIHIKDYNDISAISPDDMQEVIRDVFLNFPADNYGMIFSSHGTSWLPSNYGNMLKWFGEENKKHMEIYELAEGIPDEYHLDFLLFDVCSMGGIECVYELKDKADYIVASPAETMAYGFPYEKFLPYLFEFPANLNGVSQAFYNFYLNPPIEAQTMPYGCIAVTKTSQLDELAIITRDIIISNGGEEAIYSLPYEILQSLSYLPNAATKLYDFSDVIKHLATDEQYTHFKECMDKTVISKYSTDYIYSTKGGRTKVNYFSGLSIYPPQEKLLQLTDWYRNNIKWYKAVYK